MDLRQSHDVIAERHCVLIFLAGMAVVAASVPVVIWGVEALWSLLR